MPPRRASPHARARYNARLHARLPAMLPRYRRLLFLAFALLAAQATAETILPAAVPPPSIAAKAYLWSTW